MCVSVCAGVYGVRMSPDMFPKCCFTNVFDVQLLKPMNNHGKMRNISESESELPPVLNITELPRFGAFCSLA